MCNLTTPVTGSVCLIRPMEACLLPPSSMLLANGIEKGGCTVLQRQLVYADWYVGGAEYGAYVARYVRD
jgi:hypothetical protein